MPRLINEFQQFFDGSGEPLANGLLYFYESGSSSVAKETYLDSAESIANSNPVKLNGDGRCPNVFGSGVYNVILRTSSGEQIQARDPVGGSSTLGFGSAWDAQTLYSLGFVVFYSGKYWQSLTSPNLGNLPIEGVNWTEIDLTQIGRNETSINSIREESLGIDKSWQNVTSSRSRGITYTNTSGSTISVSIVLKNDSDQINDLVVDGETLVIITLPNQLAGADYSTLTAIVPDGSTYQWNKLSGLDDDFSFTWLELR